MALQNVSSFRTGRKISPTHRTAPRLEVLDQFHGQLVAMDVPLKVRDLSIGGFSIDSPVSFPPGAVHQFRFALPNGATHQLSAKAIHCRTSKPREGLDWYVSGFEFIHEERDGQTTARTVDALIEAATSVLTFD